MPEGDTAAIKKHLWSQQKLNYIFLFYSATTGMAIAHNSQSIKTCASVVCIAGEIVYRFYSIYLLKNIEPQYEEDDPFPPASPETRHDTGKFTSGWTSRLPLIDTFSRWVFR